MDQTSPGNAFGLDIAARHADDALEHDPEKCAAVFRKDHAQTTT
jgi:hypothetical protein